jgi:hypothetical protein
MRKMPIGIQSFEKIIDEDYLYVDKTAYVHKLATEGTVYFLGRPRRFGKSLLLSTFKSYFLGKKELFKGLALDELEKDWIEYPVFHIDLNVTNYESLESLDQALDSNLWPLEEIWGRNPERANDSASTRLLGLIRRAYEQTGRKVVVLVDEYDKPLLGQIDDEEFSNVIRGRLKGFYGILKSADEYLKFVLLTGVTKFSQVSVFSDLNQLRDISLEDQYATICGITQTELEANFESAIKVLAEKNELTYDEALARMKRLYDGYHFSKVSENIYNPFSVINTLEKSDFGDYWFQTGTPTFLVKLIQQSHFDTLEFQDGIITTANALTDFCFGSTNPVPILYQSGYLTIKHYERSDNSFVLGFPNDEVEYGFLESLLPSYLEQPMSASDFDALKFKNEILAGDVDGFLTRLKAIFASLPYGRSNQNEHYYQSIFYIVFALLGQYIRVEEYSNKGRSDAVVVTKDAVYIFEFKLEAGDSDKIVDTALAQIEEQGYALPYIAGDKSLYKIGIQFDTETRNITQWKIARD